ncbi:MAG: hypothetical protein DSO03_05815 [Hadesarchaea archaeon]|nr:MAG: hypothetical protein DSO03_05815 [Hadesarchaea archaeon]
MKRPITLEEVSRNPGMLLAISALLLLVGSLGTWYSVPAGSFSLKTGWDTGMGKKLFFISLIFFTSAALHLGYISHPLLNRLFPLLPISTVCGFLALVACLAGFDSGSHYSWGLYLCTIGSLISLFASYRGIKAGM